MQVTNFTRTLFAKMPIGILGWFGVAIIAMDSVLNQALIIGSWGFFNMIASLVYIAKRTASGHFVAKELVWHFLGHLIFIFSVAFALQTQEFTRIERLLLGASTIVITIQYIHWSDR